MPVRRPRARGSGAHVRRGKRALVEQPQRQIVTFLMTDIVGSTALWDRHRLEMERAVARHVELAAPVVAQHGGTLVKSRGEGDSLFAVFADARAAVACACRLQLAWLSEPWPDPCALRIRTALNTGSVEARDGDYFGTTVNLCARIRAAGHGGQVLLSATTRELAGDVLPDGITTRSIGRHRFSGISQEVEVYQALHPLLPSDFPEIRSLTHIPTNLPYRRNPLFVGRDDVLDELHQLLSASDASQVALVGVTGVGKTQIAVEYAHRHVGDYPGGVFYANASDTARFHIDCAAIGRHFDIDEAIPTAERAARVRMELERSPAPVLLIVDNLTEHTDRGSLPSGGNCRVLVTTHQRHVVRHGFSIVDPRPLDENAALSLLQTRRVASTEEEVSAAREIAALLGYLPLPLALVANHVERLGILFAEYRTLLAEGAVEVLSRARRRFISETGHDGGLFDAIALCYQSLEPPAPVALAAASCLAGRGMSPDILFEASGIVERALFDEAVADLIDDSLMVRERDGRLSMHGLVQTFVHQLVPPTEMQPMLRRSARVLADRLRAANTSMDWTTTRREISHCHAVAELCRRNDVSREFEDLLMETAIHLYEHGEFEQAVALFDEGICTVETLRGPRDLRIATFIRKRGEARLRLGQGAEALRDAMEAMSRTEASPDRADDDLAHCHNSLGLVLRMNGRLDDALAHYEQALSIHEAAHGRRSSGGSSALNNIGTLLEAQGDLGGAMRYLDEACDISLEVHGSLHPRTAIRLNNLGRVRGKAGDWREAYRMHCEALGIFEAVYGPIHPDVAGSHYFAAVAATQLGNVSVAATHLRTALAMAPRFYMADHRFCKLLHAALGDLDSQGQQQ